jgi:hypothetical protein
VRSGEVDEVESDYEKLEEYFDSYNVSMKGIEVVISP